MVSINRKERGMASKILDKIIVDPEIMGGKPVIKGTRIPIYIIIQMVKDGLSFDEIIIEYPRLQIDDIRASLDYALHLISDEEWNIE